VPKFVTVSIIDKHAANNESVDVSANLDNESAGRERVCSQRTSQSSKHGHERLSNLGSREASVAQKTAVDKSRQPTDHITYG
jgi:hypothetical protein